MGYNDALNGMGKEWKSIPIQDCQRAKERRQERTKRTMDMQNVVRNKLAMSQQSVDNAENYPSTWTTNPDGGSNGQVK